jgi:hypothetical protein
VDAQQHWGMSGWNCPGFLIHKFFTKTSLKVGAVNPPTGLDDGVVVSGSHCLTVQEATEPATVAISVSSQIAVAGCA